MNELLAVPAIVESQHQELLVLDRRVDSAEGEGLKARWEFGQALLRRRVGKQLPAGLLDELVDATGKSRAELQFRVQFAELHPEVSKALDTFSTWTQFVSRPKDQSVHYSSATDEWATPQELFDELDAEFGFTLDVCATEQNTKCDAFYTEDEDGLAQEWKGVCWMNPPYGDAIADWIEKAHEAAESGATVVCLVPARTDTGWWWRFCRYGEVRFLRGRLKFGSSENSAPFPSAVVIFGRPANALDAHWERAA